MYVHACVCVYTKYKKVKQESMQADEIWIYSGWKECRYK